MRVTGQLKEENMGVLSDPSIRSIFENLSRAIFPLSDWLSQRAAAGGYVPAVPNLPWRKPGAWPLSIDDLKIGDFFEKLLADKKESDDATLAKRWNTLIANPPKFPRDDPIGWRTSRGLKAATKFGILDSDNFILFSQAPNQTKIAMSRAEFYNATGPAMKNVVMTVNPSTPAQWGKLVDWLRTNDPTVKWPIKTPTASEFIRQFTNDCLYALLNFSNGLLPPWNAAVPIEVGEFRRPGQNVSANEAAAAVIAFVAKT